jgi:two-component system response regulator NreC
METEVKRVLLADDHAILRAGLRLLLDSQPDMTVVGEASNGAEVLQQARKYRPDVVLLDLNMPGGDGLSTIAPLRELLPNCCILILTMHDDVQYLQDALQAGAAGYVLKRAADTELLLAIRAILNGETYVHSAMTQKLLQAMLPGAAQPEADQQATSNPWQELSEREYEVLRRVALGYTNVEISEEMYISIKTVETYRARGMEKMALQTRAQLVRSALFYGVLEE